MINLTYDNTGLHKVTNAQAQGTPITIYSMGEEYHVIIESYCYGKDRYGVKQFNDTDNLLQFYREYGAVLPVFRLIVDKL